MEGSEVTESFNEWEQIRMETDADIKNNNNITHHRQHHDLSIIFPPINHEGLQVPPQQQLPLPPAPTTPPDSPTPSGVPSSTVASHVKGEKGLPSDSKLKVGNEIRKRLKLKVEILKSWIANKGNVRSGFWSIGSVSIIVATAVLMYSRVQRWRQRVREMSQNRLILLVKEKDQKISQLLLQVARMNETLSVPQKVPVIRVG